MNKSNSRAYNRDVSRRKALRKRRIDTQTGDSPRYDNLHQYSKNKVHCSCNECNEKTRNKGKRRTSHPGNYDRSINYKASDLRKVEGMIEDEKEISAE